VAADAPPAAGSSRRRGQQRYDAIAGRSMERIAALSDGVFAVAMTLLVLDLHAPAAELVHDESALWRALLGMAPRLLVYVMSFMTLGIFWVGQQTQHNHIATSDRNLTWLHLGFLLLVTLMPFSTVLMAEFFTYRLAVAVYWLNILLLGVALYASWRYARHAGLVADQASVDVACGIERRILVAQSLYACGALLCLFSTYASLSVIALVQINYVVAPRLAWLTRHRATPS
jgi:uncharacterized membrane protein